MYGTNKSAKKHMPSLQSVRILDQLRESIRYLHYSLRMEVAYVYWARAFFRFDEKIEGAVVNCIAADNSRCISRPSNWRSAVNSRKSCIGQ